MEGRYKRSSRLRVTESSRSGATAEAETCHSERGDRSPASPCFEEVMVIPETSAGRPRETSYSRHDDYWGMGGNYDPISESRTTYP